ncbi:putative uroporphyrinogen-III C-methyltransferase [Zancudomyces culisetae]|nr:putative uroporphyrinogen-III C-methyltransferase [Zancudomyces culisetae]|eukprot:OMH81817.1 putative uroporphyrinogen-III C-methyltransferase [Zancudomyces culisetae]
MSMHRDGPLQIAVSTNSKAPRLANRIRRKIAAAMPIGAGKAIENIGELREKIKAGNPGIQNVGRRMGWMKEFCDYWPIEEIAKIGSDDIDRIFTSYLDQKSAGSVPLNGVKVEEGQAEERYQVDNESQVETKPASDVPEEKPEDQTTKDKEVLEESTSSLSSSSVGQVYCRSRFSPKNATAGESAKVSGCLYLVGAGIGKPELMTIQAKEVLETADVILSDKLVSKEILDMISDIQKVRNSEKKLEIFIARKFTGMADAAQNELNIKGLEALEQGKVVVRLKQGDPFLYGRGGEEVLFYEEHGYKCRVIPGISSALSGPLLSRISVTHRGVADQVLILSGNDRNRSLPKVPEYLQSRTLVILMCIKRLNDIVQLLLSSGYPAELPIAIVERAGSEDQRTLRGTLSNIVSILERLGSNPPGLIVVGHVVNVLQSTKPFEISDINSIVRENSQNVEECGEMIAA